MTHTRQDDYLSILYPKHKPVEVINPNTPPPCAVILEGLRLADA